MSIGRAKSGCGYSWKLASYAERFCAKIPLYPMSLTSEKYWFKGLNPDGVIVSVVPER